MNGIYFDMDGTIADLYGDPDWLVKLDAYDPSPYENARPLLNLSRLARLIHKVQNLGYHVGIISWLSRTSTSDYDKKVTDAKRAWLARHLPSVKFDSIHIVKYGVPKETIGSGILFDDEERNRINWGMGAHTETEIFQTLIAIGAK